MRVFTLCGFGTGDGWSRWLAIEISPQGSLVENDMVAGIDRLVATPIGRLTSAGEKGRCRRRGGLSIFTHTERDHHMAPKPNEGSGDALAGIRRAVAIDASGGNVDANGVTRGVYVGVTGNLAVVFADQPDSAAVTLVGLAAGIWHPMQIQKVMQSGTTATSVFAGF